MAANGADLLSRIGLGCYALGGGYGNVTEPDAEATVDAAIACGWTLVDTAESYLDSEYRLGGSSSPDEMMCSWPRRYSPASRTMRTTSSQRRKRACGGYRLTA